MHLLDSNEESVVKQATCLKRNLEKWFTNHIPSWETNATKHSFQKIVNQGVGSQICDYYYHSRTSISFILLPFTAPLSLHLSQFHIKHHVMLYYALVVT